MILTPDSFTYEYLSSLKFKELQKLSVQFQVNKRWAKKQELIENLLALQKKESTPVISNLNDAEEWKDGSTVFNDVQQNEKEVNRRLTFNISKKSNTEHIDPRLTFEVSQNGKNLLSEEFNSRETYDTSPSVMDLGVEPLIESRATFEVPQKKLKVDPRATFDVPQNGKKLLDESQMVMNKSLNLESVKKLRNSDVNKKEVGKIAFRQNFENVKPKEKQDEKNVNGKQQVKTLTIPYARVTRRNKKDGETSKTDNSPIKMSKKSINIKKTTRLPVSKSNLVKSPAISSVKNSVHKQTIIQSLTNPHSGKITQSKVPVRLNFNSVKEGGKSDDGNKENMRKILRTRISKTVDENLGKKSNLVKVNFRTPPPSITKTCKVMPVKKTPLRKELGGKLNKSAATTPGNKSTTKTITATKMPDFSKIHKRQFEQMDSLHDYLKKKEERIKKLFGTPQPGHQLQVHNKTAPVFRFQSATVEKENKERETLKTMMTPLKKKEDDSKAIRKEAFKSKLPPLKLRSEIKDKNRSHIHGVRTNKRFELQMKFRNM